LINNLNKEEVQDYEKRNYKNLNSFGHEINLKWKRHPMAASLVYGTRLS
jgi:hypothetical protein